MKNKKMIAAIGVVLVVAAGWFMLIRDTGLPYTSTEMSEADIKCDGEVIAQATDKRAAVLESFSSSSLNVDCLAEELPELDSEQLADLPDLIEETQQQEWDEAFQKELDEIDNK